MQVLQLQLERKNAFLSFKLNLNSTDINDGVLSQKKNNPKMKFHQKN